MTQRSDDTRDRLIAAALPLFADKGFHATSIAAIAADLGLTKQALLHHFGSKEKLYGAVLAALSDRLSAALKTDVTSPDPGSELRRILATCHAHFQTHVSDARLILRELLENPDRAETARKWYLRDFLSDVTTLAQRHPRWQGVPRAEVFAAIYQLVGALNYYAVSGPTLSGILGPDGKAGIDAAFPGALDKMLSGT